jgi:hypothetical protein
MNTCIHHFLQRIFAALLLLHGVALHSLRAADSAALDKAILVAGTTYADNGGSHWSYLVWQPGDDALLSGKTLAVYRKTGDAASASPYARQSVITAAWDSRTVAAALSRAQNVGEDLTALESAINENFRGVLLPNSASLAEKLLYCVQAAMEDEELRDNLKLLARRHPGLGLVLGRAYVDRLAAGGQVTYELREFDADKLADLGVIGRVTLTPGQAAALPAPHAPFHVLPLVRSGADGKTRNEAKKRHLTVELRWGTPDNLRLRSLLQFGFNLYRVDKAYAEANGLLPQPATSVLLSHLTTAPDKVARVNRLPILPDVDLTDAEATNAVERSTSFFSDDRDRFSGGIPFQDGQKFYYYVTARDVLGRDGAASPGALVTVCGWLPPFPPRDMRSEPVYSYDTVTKTGSQHFRLRWLPAEPGEGVAAIAGYHLYRWQSIEQMQHFAPSVGADGLFRGNEQPAAGTGHIAYVPHAAATTRYSYDDVNDAASPKTPANAGQSWIYTVRAVDTGVCGPNISPDSAPTVGNLFDLSLTEAPAGVVKVNRFTASLIAKPINTTTLPNGSTATTGVHHVIFRCTGMNTAMAEAAEFYDASTNFIALAAFNAGVATVTADVPVVLSGGGDKLWCRVRLRHGVTTPLEPSLPLPVASGIALHTVPWELQVTASLVEPLPQDDDVVHHAGPGLDGSSISGPTVDLTCGAATTRYRLYRRVNEGPLTLISQGPLPDGVQNVSVQDQNPPQHSARLCYYAQADDGKGHYSPLALIKCIESRTSNLPRPTLKPLTSTVLGNGPAMLVEWVCPPYGVERFEVWLVKENSNPPADAGTGLSDNLRTNLPAYDAANPPFTPPFGAYETPRVAALQAGVTPTDRFAVTIPIEANTHYLVAVRAVGPGEFSDVMVPADAIAAVEGRPVGEFSEMQLHRWSSSTEPQPVVPQGDLAWPARPLARVLPQAAVIQARFDRVVNQAGGQQVKLGPRVSIGSWRRQPNIGWEGIRQTGAVTTSVLGGHIDPMSYLSTVAALPSRVASNAPFAWLLTLIERKPALPCALYRRQVPSAKFPNVSGDLVQVTPLVEEIAHEWADATAQFPAAHTVIHDPWVVAQVDQTGPNPVATLWLVDRHPVVTGASYEYYVVFYDATTHEVRAVMPTNTVDIP